MREKYQKKKWKEVWSEEMEDKQPKQQNRGAKHDKEKTIFKVRLKDSFATEKPNKPPKEGITHTKIVILLEWSHS